MVDVQEKVCFYCMVVGVSKISNPHVNYESIVVLHIATSSAALTVRVRFKDIVFI